MSGLVLTPQMGDVLARQIAETGVLSGADRHWLSLEWQRLAASEPRPLSQLADSGPHLDRILDPGGPCLREAEYERAFLGVQSLQTAVAEDEAAHRPLPIMQGALHLLHEGHQEGDSRYRKEQLLHLPADSRQQRSRSSSQGNSAPIHPLDYAVDQLGWEGWLHYRTLLMRQRQEFSLQVAFLHDAWAQLRQQQVTGQQPGSVGGVAYALQTALPSLPAQSAGWQASGRMGSQAPTPSPLACWHSKESLEAAHQSTYGNGQQAASGTSSLPQPPHHGPAPHARADWQELTSLLQPEPQQQCTGMFQGASPVTSSLVQELLHQA